MLRAIAEFLVLLVIFLLTRAVVGALQRTLGGAFFTGGFQPPPTRGPERPSGRSEILASNGELQKDPVCGTFVPVSTSWKRVTRGETFYFCSADCRDRFAVAK